ncbi:unnamed protein product [Dibothriocephalus latus]|uniref:Hexosyltransferase n=1 Tax=Dibothriocephalus latus TaxID=60516 RepID=A0A3P7N2V3_DIBLA|nr:unnamed protein product [Dibothriocephalus latus]
MMTAFQWAARFCRTERPGFLFIDDDFGFHQENLRPFLGRLSAGWRERMREMPWPRLAPYSYGELYFLGYERVKKLVITTHFPRPIPIDDVWLCLIMSKLGRRFQYQPGIRLRTRLNGIRKRDILMPMPALYKRLQV